MTKFLVFKLGFGSRYMANFYLGDNQVLVCSDLI